MHFSSTFLILRTASHISLKEGTSMVRPHQLSESLSFDPELQCFLFGKEHLLEELPFPEHMIQEHACGGYIVLRRGIEILDKGIFPLWKGRQRHKCNRCGNHDPEAFGVCMCGRCGKSCVYCRHCLHMGVIRSCTRLVTWSGPEPQRQNPIAVGDGELCVWGGALSGEQAKAAEALDRSLTAGRSFLIWAVTGAGKTELLFPAIAHALLRGWRLALATPRTDVVRELAPRLRAAFPDVLISALYGGSSERFAEAPLVIATTHQLIRFHRFFDCVIIDEVDAFPFHFDPMLEYAVRKAAREHAPTAYLTATPPAVLKNAYLSGKLPGIKIARRYHGHPLPVPQFRWTGNWKQSIGKKLLPPAFLQWIQQKMAAEGRLLLFVPSVTLSRELTELLQREGISHVAGVHAGDPDRHVKVTFFREGQIRVLVTTTILERGVTVPGIEVAVFGADDPIFDERALVQIAGRVGRSPDYPGGEVIFFHHGKTLEMLRARKHLEQMNREAGF